MPFSRGSSQHWFGTVLTDILKQPEKWCIFLHITTLVYKTHLFMNQITHVKVPTQCQHLVGACSFPFFCLGGDSTTSTLTQLSSFPPPPLCPMHMTALAGKKGLTCHLYSDLGQISQPISAPMSSPVKGRRSSMGQAVVRTDAEDRRQ